MFIWTEPLRRPLSRCARQTRAGIAERPNAGAGGVKGCLWNLVNLDNSDAVRISLTQNTIKFFLLDHVADVFAWYSADRITKFVCRSIGAYMQIDTFAHTHSPTPSHNTHTRTHARTHARTHLHTSTERSYVYTVQLCLYTQTRTPVSLLEWLWLQAVVPRKPAAGGWRSTEHDACRLLGFLFRPLFALSWVQGAVQYTITVSKYTLCLHVRLKRQEPRQRTGSSNWFIIIIWKHEFTLSYTLTVP